MNLLTAAHIYLSGDSGLTSLLGSSSDAPVWLFQSTLGAVVENSQTCAVVIDSGGQWARPNDYNTMRFPVLQVDIYADPQRNPDNGVYTDDTKAKVEAVFVQLLRLLHQPNNQLSMWGGPSGVRVMGTKASDSEPLFYPLSGDRWATRARCSFEISMG